jgi:hypothetical protein
VIALPFLRRRPATVPTALPDQLAAVLDEVAEAYAAARPPVSCLLANHARRVAALDAAVIDPHAEQWQLAFLAAEAEDTRAALLDLSPTALAIARTTPETTE